MDGRRLRTVFSMYHVPHPKRTCQPGRTVAERAVAIPQRNQRAPGGTKRSRIQVVRGFSVNAFPEAGTPCRTESRRRSLSEDHLGWVRQVQQTCGVWKHRSRCAPSRRPSARGFSSANQTFPARPTRQSGFTLRPALLLTFHTPQRPTVCSSGPARRNTGVFGILS